VLIALIWAVALIFGIDFLLNNSAKNRKDKLLAEFPDFIKITEGFLDAGFTFTKAVENSIKYVEIEWQDYLKKLLIDSELYGIDSSLENFKNDLNLFEVKEFVSIVRLNLEQGGSAKESFLSQADRVLEIRKNVLLMKIGKRQIIGTMLQAPLLLCNIMVFALPVVKSMTSLTSI
jgi:Flp pilus assembly protein TadB